MKLIVIGTDHMIQSSADLSAIIERLTKSENITVIGEEAPGQSVTVVQQIAQDKGILWVQVDMTDQQRIDCGIHDKLSSRMEYSFPLKNGMPMFTFDEFGAVPNPVYFQKEDAIREHFWLDRIEDMKTDGTAIIVCGGLHARPLSEKAQQRGHTTELLFYPELPLSQFWLSEKPILI
jgi:hypothetical protein